MKPRQLYEKIIREGGFSEDPSQVQVLSCMDQLYDQLLAHKKSLPWYQRLFQSENSIAPASLYLWGDVGRGKTMLLDLFYQSLPFKEKRRDHFQRFMLSIHRELHEMENSASQVKNIARQFAKQCRVLCLDEFRVYEVSDAMVLTDFLLTLHECGVVVVLTSNMPPERLYLNGLQRESFIPTIELIESKYNVIELNNPEDYRRIHQSTRENCYVVIKDEEDKNFIKGKFEALCGSDCSEESLEINRRIIPVVGRTGQCLWLDFETICGLPLWAADYLKIAENYQCVFVENVPAMTEARDNVAKRFIHLVDALYDHRVKLFLTLGSEPEELYQGRFYAFAFRRTISRLNEMGSAQYQALPHRIFDA